MLLPPQIQEAKRYCPSTAELPRPQMSGEPAKLAILAKPGNPPQAPSLDRDTLNTLGVIGLFVAAFLGAISRGALLVVGLAVIGWFWFSSEIEISSNAIKASKCPLAASINV